MLHATRLGFASGLRHMPTMKGFLRHTALFLLCAAAPLLLAAQTPDELLERGKGEYARGNYRSAQELFQRAWASDKEAGSSGQESELRYRSALGQAHLKLREHDQALQHFKAALSIAQVAHGQQSEAVARCYLDIGNVYAQMYEPEQAVAAYLEALQIFEQEYGRESSSAGNALMNIGTAIQKMGNYQDAESYYLRAYQVFQRSSAPDSEDFNRIYSNMGYLYRKRGDLQKALEFGQKALEIKLKNYPGEHPSVAKYYTNVGKVYQQLGAHEAALPYMEEGLRIAESALGSNHPQTAGAMGELAGVYADLNNYPMALRLYREGRQRLEKTLPPDHPYVLASSFNLATVYRVQGANQEALAQYQYVLNALNARSYRPVSLIARACLDIADVWLELDHLDSALAYGQRGLQELSGNHGRPLEHWANNPDLSDIQDELALLKLLESKTRILESFAKRQEQPELMLQAALSTVELALCLISRLRQGYASEASRQHLNTGSSGLYQTGVRSAMKLYHLTGQAIFLWKAFEISESSKASLLWRNLNEDLALLSAGLPETEGARLRQLEKQMADLEEELADAAERNLPESVQALQSALFDSRQAYTELLAGLEQAYPRFYALRNALPDLDQTVLIKKLEDERSSMLAFFYDENDVYIFLLNQSALHGFSQALPPDFEASIRGLRSTDIGAFSYSNDMAAAYLQQVHLLYELLIGPCRSALNDESRLLIVPHGMLNYLPFELLAPSIGHVDFRKQAYLLRSFPIHYAWSAALWANPAPERKTASLAYAGFAPDYPMVPANSGYRSQLAGLTFSASEVKLGKQRFGGEVLLDASATESAFRDIAPRSAILHLAAHAMVYDERPLRSGLAFSVQDDSLDDGFLHAYEIYNLELPAELAVLSACNSGYGRLEEGEGAISLGRAFFHAGCRSIIMSQWLANDHSSARLMDFFYQHLAQGLPKDQALRQAKLDYLNAADALTAHPYFWAGMTAIGNMNPISPKGRLLRVSQPLWPWLIGLSALVLSMLAFARIKFGHRWVGQV